MIVRIQQNAIENLYKKIEASGLSIKENLNITVIIIITVMDATGETMKNNEEKWRI